MPVPQMTPCPQAVKYQQPPLMSDCQLRPRYPINYNETVLTKLHRLPQIKTFNNLSIPLPVTKSESEEDENYEHYIKLDTQTFNNQV